MSLNFYNGFVIDTNLLLIHSAGFYKNVELLKRAGSSLNMHENEIPKFFRFLDNIISSTNNIVISPYCLSEFCNLINSRLRLRDDRYNHFIISYYEYLTKMKEHFIDKNTLIKFKATSKFCFADSSLVIIAERDHIPLISTDRALIGWCKKNNILAENLVNVYHNHSARFGY